MIDRLITFALERRLFVGLIVAFLLGGGVWAVSTLPVEAFPDLTANSVTIIAEAPGMAAQDVEQQVTFPLERALLGLPRTEEVRSTSKFGLSITQVIFDDRVDSYFARQVVGERIGVVAGSLPPGVSVELGPISTAMGEVYQYVLVSENERWNSTALKTLHDYTIAPQLRTIGGVAEVNSWGGFTEQYHVTVDPERLARAGLTLTDVEEAIARNNRNFGGAYTEDRGERFVVRGVGRLGGLDDIANVQVSTRSGVPLRVGDLAEVSSGTLPRQGAVTYNGIGEVVSGMVIMRKGENARRVIASIEERVEEVRRTLPAGVDLVPFYEQTELVNQTAGTVRKNLMLGATLVVILLWLFLRNFAASLIVAVVIPLSMLWAFVAMRMFGYSANLMSLGALDFGLLVDASVVMVENIMRRAEEKAEGAVTRIRAAALEVARPMAFGTAIVVAVYLPIFALGGTERKLFVPMAFTVTMAILGSLLLALTFVPAASRFFLRNAREVHMPWFERLRSGYRRTLTRILPRPLPVITGAGFLVLIAVVSATRLGTEFMPRLDEGSVLVQTMRLPSTALDQGVEFSLQLERALLTLPEVETVVSKLGRPDLATEAMPTYESDTYVILKDRREWRPGGKPALLEAMDSALQTVPGVGYAFTQPIQMRLDEAETGITTDVGVKIFGSDPERLASLADRVERVIARVPGAADVKVTAASLINEVSLVLDREALARHGMDSESVGRQIDLALGSTAATQVIDGPRRIDVVVRVPESSTIDPDLLLSTLLVSTPEGGLVPLGAVTRTERVLTPEALAHEGGQRMVVVGANIRGRDVGSFVTEATRAIGEQVRLPEGYRVEWGGQYQNQQSAMRRLSFLVPGVILLIFLLLFTAFGTARHALLILVNVPFALVGGIAALWIGGLNLSTSAIIGFIAVFGISVLNGVVMVSYINRLREEGRALRNAVLEGAATRLRPVLMTASSTILGFVPMAISTSPGAELQRPLASVVIGGLCTATALTLLVLPLLYYSMERIIDRQEHAVIRFARVRPYRRIAVGRVVAARAARVEAPPVPL